MPSVQEAIKERIVEELKNKLHTELGIDKIHIQPFNTVELNGVYLFDKQNEQILRADKLYAGISLFSLLQKEVVVTAVRLNDFDIKLSKETSGSPLNIQFIIDAFKSPDDENKSKIEVKINTLSISNGNLSFDIKDKPVANNPFDPNHIQVSDFNAHLSLKSLKSDSLNIQIKKLALKEKSGLEIENLKLRLISQAQSIQVKGFMLETPKSLLQFGKCEIDLSKVDSPKNLADSACINCSIVSSYITPKDLSPFSKVLKNFEDRIYLKCKVLGTINDFDVSDISLDYGDKMQLSADASITHALDKELLYLSGNVNDLRVTTEGIAGLINNFSDNKKTLPKQIHNLGTVTFSGNISGQLKKLRAHGFLNSKPGSVTAKLDFGFNTESGIESFFTGSISSGKFKLGELLEDEKFDELSFNLDIDLQKYKHKTLGGKVKGDISHFDYKGYPYRHIALNGKYDGLKMEGALSIDDENVFLDVDGLFDFSQKQPVLNFIAKLQNLRLDKLNLSDKYSNSYLSLDVNANFSGDNIDNAEGYLNIDSIRFYRDGDQFFMDNILIEASGSLSDRKLKVSSDIINGEALGEYSFLTMPKSITQTLHSYLPALINFDKKDAGKIQTNNLSFNFTVNNTEQVSKIFSLPFTIYSQAKIIGFYNNIYNKFRLEVYYPSGKVAGANVKSVYLLAENTADKINADITGIFVGKNDVLNDVSIDLTAGNNTVNTELNLTNNSKQTFDISFAALTNFSREKAGTPLKTEIEIMPRNIVLNDTVWAIDKSHISIGSGELSVNNFNISNKIGKQAIDINGKYSQTNPYDTLKVNLNKINLEYVFNTLAINALNFGGSATGTLNASSVDGKPYPHINLDVDGFRFNKAPLGRLRLYSELEDITNNILLKGTLLDEEKRQTDITGFINPVKKELSLNFDANKVNIAFLNKYAASLFNNISGRGSGKVHLFGDFSNVTVEGKAFIENGSLGINFLNTTYTFTDTVYLKKDLIYFNDLRLYDQYKNKALVSGKVVHDYFANFMYYVELSGSNFMMYNVTEKLNPMFFGKAFGSGSGSISGDERAVNIDARLQTNTNTNICMNFMKETVQNYSFITYRNNDSIATDTLKTAQQLTGKPLKTESGMEVNMNFYIDATPDATVEMVMDPVGGDKLKGSGNGAIQFVWGSKIAPRLYGTYTISKGDYNFTFQKIMERRFSIQDGSSILFQGDPFRANLDVAAKYKLNANLKDLDQDLVRNTGQTSIPVECILNITGELQHPNVGLDIALPAADPEVQRQVKSLMNNEDMINRQMAYLLLLSKFYTPGYFNVDRKTNDFASVASATLSTQLTKVLSMIDNRWQFGTNIRTSDANFNDTEVELLLSSQILNDRVLLNGNFGYRSFDNSSSSISEMQQQDALIHDIDVEVLLNRRGTWRLKIYNHYNEKYYISRSDKNLQTQGIGLLYKRDFDKLSEIFNFQYKKPAPKQDSIQAILPDFSIKGSHLGEFIRIKK
ncbi:translocation/assembly module TamB domain-containing protein [Viscerimonas tarda]